MMHDKTLQSRLERYQRQKRWQAIGARIGQAIVVVGHLAVYAAAVVYLWGAL